MAALAAPVHRLPSVVGRLGAALPVLVGEGDGRHAVVAVRGAAQRGEPRVGQRGVPQGFAHGLAEVLKPGGERESGVEVDAQRHGVDEAADGGLVVVGAAPVRGYGHQHRAVPCGPREGHGERAEQRGEPGHSGGACDVAERVGQAAGQTVLAVGTGRAGPLSAPGEEHARGRAVGEPRTPVLFGVGPLGGRGGVAFAAQCPGERAGLGEVGRSAAGERRVQGGDVTAQQVCRAAVHDDVMGGQLQDGAVPGDLPENGPQQGFGRGPQPAVGLLGDGTLQGVLVDDPGDERGRVPGGHEGGVPVVGAHRAPQHGMAPHQFGDGATHGLAVRARGQPPGQRDVVRGVRRGRLVRGPHAEEAIGQSRRKRVGNGRGGGGFGGGGFGGGTGPGGRSEPGRLDGGLQLGPARVEQTLRQIL